MLATHSFFPIIEGIEYQIMESYPDPMYMQPSLSLEPFMEYSTVWLHAGFVLWIEPCECGYLSHTPSGCVDFTSIARALRVLFTHRREDWADDKITSIIEELTSKLYIYIYCI